MDEGGVPSWTATDWELDEIDRIARIERSWPS